MSSRWMRTIRRISDMEAAELAGRSRQRLSAYVDSWTARLGRKFVEPIETAHLKLGDFYFASGEITSLVNVLRSRLPETAADTLRRAEHICDHRFDLLGYEHLDYGRHIDWHCDMVHGKRAPRVPFYRVPYLDFDVVGDSKITWELNRHQHFITLAKAWRLSGEERFVREIFAQFQHWREFNPYPIGINWASSLEVAIRSIAWTWTWFLLADAPLFAPDLRREWIRGLQLSARHLERYLSTYFSPNTHLLGECAGLFTLGTLFPSLPGSSRWSATGWGMLWRSARQQVRGDGFHFERSTYYHVYALDILLHCRALASRNGMTIPADADELLTQMLRALKMRSSGGRAHTLGDDDGGRWFDRSRNRAEHLLDPLAVGAALLKIDDTGTSPPGLTEEALWLLGVNGVPRGDTEPSRDLPRAFDVSNSGVRLASGQREKPHMLIAEGPMGRGTGGHAHADLLSIQLIQNGEPVLIDCGTFQYTRQNGERHRLRGTSAHNTMTVDGKDQAQSNGTFSWKSLPTAIVEECISPGRFDLFVGSHDGYTRLPNPVRHRRLVFSACENFWFVLDRAEGGGMHNLRVRWHLSPSLVPSESDAGVFAAPSQYLGVIAAPESGWTQRRLSAAWSPVYGKQENCTVIEFERDGQIPAELATVLVSDTGEARDIGTLEKFSVDSAVGAYRYRTQQKDHLFFVPAGRGSWRCLGWESDASFVYAIFDRVTGKMAVALCRGWYVDLEGSRILSPGHCVRYAWGAGKPGEVVLLESEPEAAV